MSSFKRFVLINIVFLFIIIIGCSNKNINEVIIAKVADKNISLNEFIRRAEYTIRPSYCKNNSNVDKQIVLNSLIAEKIFSIDAGKHGDDFRNSEDARLYIQGRKEQAMRQVLYNNEVVKKVRLDELPINQYLQYANRKYNLSYISIIDSNALVRLNEELNVMKMDFDTLLTEFYNLKKIPHKEVFLNSRENSILIDTLFTRNLKKGEVIGPIEITPEHHMFLKINGWTETPAITEKAIFDTHKKVQEMIELRERKKIFKKFVQEVMKDKTIKFNREIFFRFTDLVAPIYMKTNKDRENLFILGIWNDPQEEKKYKDVELGLEQIKDKLILTETGDEWTVKKLLREMKKRPLTFRENNIPQKDFGFQLQLAIIDLVRDKYLTEVAYDENIDKNYDVVRNTKMWEDNLNALGYKYSYLKKNKLDSLYNQNHIYVLANYLNGFVDSLQKVYSDSIYINVEEFNKINITRIQMVGTYFNSPFKTVVPNFPILTTDYRINYGKKI